MDLAGSTGAVVFAVLGLVFGSLATALSYRLPRGEPIAAARSRCPHCSATLGVVDLLPVLSWIAAKGRCRHCGAPISWRYPLMELATAALFAAAWWRAGGEAVSAALLALTLFGLVVIVVADLEARIIPNVMLLALLPVALGWRWWTGGDWADAAAGSVLGMGLTWAARAAFRRWRGRDGLGLGDVKFLGLAGIYVGLDGLGSLLVLAGLLGLALGVVWRSSGRGAVFPLGPALCVALAAGLFWRTDPAGLTAWLFG